jgi:hypothetical protein
MTSAGTWPGRSCAAIVLAGAATTLAVLGLTGCASRAARVDEQAIALGDSRAVVPGEPFRHVVYSNERPVEAGVLHVYIEGDGSPYLDRRTVAVDPTSRDPLMLRLMALDPAAAVYVGRPCYLGLADEPPCTPYDWTIGRFSVQVVASMAVAIRRLAADRGATTLELYGHSGGGALAMLLAGQVPGVTRVVTLAGNLDVRAWTTYHGYTPLDGSLDPVRVAAIPVTVKQQHYVGSDDDAMPSWIVQDAATSLGAAGGAVVLQGVTHARGWDRVWPAILAGQTPPGH